MEEAEPVIAVGGFVYDFPHDLINYIDIKAKCRHLKNLTCKGTFRQVFIRLRPIQLLGFCLGWSSNFVGSESVQRQSVKILQNMVSNTPPPTPSHTPSVHTYGKKRGGGGRVEPEGMLKRKQFTKLGPKYQHD